MSLGTAEIIEYRQLFKNKHTVKMWLGLDPKVHVSLPGTNMGMAANVRMYASELIRETKQTQADARSKIGSIQSFSNLLEVHSHSEPIKHSVRTNAEQREQSIRVPVVEPLQHVQSSAVFLLAPHGLSIM